ncbi:hypothetical protein PsorP6_011328 [Peronosclerospora sorghi]|uniref:Uncharacterized protein n=1 Tax=Peronosclerospora sorghi TaxID=230839 RepID=A0ACC0WKF1_9STRA|nr:hypothetical protein PsorP6_011328 [Peronosclerospora sorghi]
MADEGPRNGQPSVEQLQPPPSAIVGTSFPSRNEMETALNGFAAGQGYAIIVYYKCDRGGTYKNSHNLSNGKRKRRTSSRLMDFPFKGRGDAKADGSWTFSIITSDHNHNPSSHPSGHSTHQKLCHEQLAIVKGLLDATVPPRGIPNQLEGTHGVKLELARRPVQADEKP